MYGYIYKITNKVNNKVYVGQTTKSISERFRVHCKYAKHAYKSGSYLHKAMKKYGIENFIYEELDTAESKEELDIKEKDWIKKLDSRNSKIGYNLHEGGTGGITYIGKKVSTPKQLAALEYGRHLPASEKQKSQLAERRRNCEVSKLTRQKLREKSLGHKASEETRKKLSEKAKGRKRIVTDANREHNRLASTDRVHIHKGTINKNPKRENLQKYLDEGYQLGYYYKE